MPDLECQFETFLTPEGTHVFRPQIVQVWNNYTLMVTAIVMINAATSAEFVSCKIDDQIHLRYCESSLPQHTMSQTAVKIVFQILGLKEFRDYEIDLSCVN